MRRLAVIAAAGALAGTAPPDARAALFFLFEPTAAKAGDTVSIRTAGTPATFTARQRLRPFQRPVRLYLVANDDAPGVRTRLDRRLHFIGSLVPDRRGRGILHFTLPPLDAGSYAVAAWCPACAAFSRGRAFFVLHVDANVVARYRPLMLLRVQAPEGTDECPTTRANGSAPPGLASLPATFHGNGALWAMIPSDGVLPFRAERVGADGSMTTKLIWYAAGVSGELIARAEQLDGPGAATQASGILGSQRGFRGSATWATRTHFTSEGCWKITARVRDITLSFVLKVLVRSTLLN